MSVVLLDLVALASDPVKGEKTAHYILNALGKTQVFPNWKFLGQTFDLALSQGASAGTNMRYYAHKEPSTADPGVDATKYFYGDILLCFHCGALTAPWSIDIFLDGQANTRSKRIGYYSNVVTPLVVEQVVVVTVPASTPVIELDMRVVTGVGGAIDIYSDVFFNGIVFSES